MNEKRSFMVTFIGDGCVLTAFLFILSLFPKVTERIGMYVGTLPSFMKVPILSEGIMKALIAIIFLVVSYGYFRLKRWGYFLLVSINVFSLIGWIISFHLNEQQSFFQNPVATIMGLIFIIPTIKYFDKKAFA